MVVEVVFVIVLPWSDEGEITSGIVGGKKADFAGGVAGGGEEEEGAAASFFDLEAKALVGFIVEFSLIMCAAVIITFMP